MRLLPLFHQIWIPLFITSAQRGIHSVLYRSLSVFPHNTTTLWYLGWENSHTPPNSFHLWATTSWVRILNVGRAWFKRAAPRNKSNLEIQGILNILQALTETAKSREYRNILSLLLLSFKRPDFKGQITTQAFIMLGIGSTPNLCLQLLHPARRSWLSTFAMNPETVVSPLFCIPTFSGTLTCLHQRSCKVWHLRRKKTRMP